MIWDDQEIGDSWGSSCFRSKKKPNSLHATERATLREELFTAAAKGIRVAILSGAVHVSAVFVLSAVMLAKSHLF